MMNEALSEVIQSSILVIDDTPANLRLLSGMLEEQQFPLCSFSPYLNLARA